MKILLVILLLSRSIAAQLALVPSTPTPVILDGDIGNDVSIDDGLYAAVRLQQLGYINLIAVSTSASAAADMIPDSAAYLASHLYWANLKSAPIAAYQGSFPAGAQYTDHDYCRYVQGQNTLNGSCSYPSGDMPHQVAIAPSYLPTAYTDPVTVYRTALAAAANASVVMIETGISQNFAALLNSPADGISPLTGSQLIAQKVAYLIQMGGRNPTSTPSCCTPQGSEWNFEHAPSEARDIALNWPTVIYYSGFEIGFPGPVLGTGIYSSLPSNNPLYIAHQVYQSETRNGWDVAAIFFAIQGTTNGYFALSAAGSNSIDATTGANTFSTVSPPNPARYYLIQSRSDADFQSVLNPLLTTDIKVILPSSVLGGKAVLAGSAVMR